jgi:hypothetical protein
LKSKLKAGSSIPKTAIRPVYSSKANVIIIELAINALVIYYAGMKVYN